MVDPFEQPGPEVLGEPESVYLITLVGDRARMFGIADQKLVDERASQVKEPLREGALFKSEMDRAAESAKEIAEAAALV